jgi:hypothetical protein
MRWSDTEAVSGGPSLLGEHTFEVVSEWLGWPARACEEFAAGTFGAAVPPDRIG